MSNARLRVCMVVESVGGGISRHLIDLTEALAQDHNVDVHVVWSPMRGDSDFADWIERSGLPHMPLKMLRRPGFHDFHAVNGLRKYLRRNGPFHVAHGHSSKGGAIARLACLGTGIRTVYTPNAFVTMNPSMNIAARMMFSAVEFALSKMTSQLIAVSPEEEKCARRLGFGESQITLIPNCITPITLPQREEIRNELGFSREDIVIGYVGRMVPQKHPMMLVEAFAKVVYRFPKALLAMVGDGPLMPEVMQGIERCGIGSRVRLLGARSGRILMPGFDIFSLPSRFEGLPYVALEAMSAGLPLVVTSGCNCSLLVDPQVSGIITPTGNAEQFADAIAVMVSNPLMRREMGAAGKQRVAAFNLSRMASETYQVYVELVNEAQGLTPSVVEAVKA